MRRLSDGMLLMIVGAGLGPLGLNLLSYQRVQPLAGREIDLDAEIFLKQPFGRYQIENTESSAWVNIDEQIQIALGASRVARC